MEMEPKTGNSLWRRSSKLATANMEKELKTGNSIWRSSLKLTTAYGKLETSSSVW